MLTKIGRDVEVLVHPAPRRKVARGRITLQMEVA